MMHRFLNWRGRDPFCEPDQVANALDSFVDLTPVSEGPAVQTRANWAALLPGQEVPLIGEETGYADPEEV